MSDTHTRLVKCFGAVFPEVPEAELPQASTATVAAWDSLASITLLTVLEEEFGIAIDPEQLEHLQSFQSVLEYVERHQSRLTPAL
jgi:acyl carrier protein